eukprot:CAMPEP_0196815708 /NCGR_PEP_ID=MMETSP1362-20130617/51355_1 /TAXON_ID=163516 /ORGANISM="Leptocylindrus danicus, Strain CCMP1856" /LENGTH=322 /DNA_ID=CAMNT_0042192763 /DNA_START=379 /DNA_END=1347 /DNA_ORIENTATION=-
MAVDQDGCLAMHIACYRGAPVDVIMALHEANADGVKTQDRYGWLPIHIACYHQAPKQVIAKLNLLYPEGLSDENSSQREMSFLQDHIACTEHYETATEISGESSHSLNGKMVKLRKKESNGRGLVPEGNNNNMPDDSFHGAPNVDEASKSNEDGWLPMHIACYQNCELEIIENLYNAFKKGVTKTDKHGWLPLHLACYHNASADTIKFLVDKHAKGASIKNEFDCLPLHLACEKGADDEVMQLLCDAFPGGLKMKNYWKNLPIHRAVYQGLPASAIQILVKAYPESVNIKNGEGETPLDLARRCEHLDNREEILEALNCVAH